MQSFCEEPIELESGWEQEAEQDVASVDFTRFPICCDSCGEDVSAMVRTCVCIACREPFDAAALVLEQHGPEAFTTE